MTKLESLLSQFDYLGMSPEAWPLHVTSAIAGQDARRTWPAFPHAATLARGRLGHGAGFEAREAQIRAAGELIEIASCCAWGDERLVEASPAEIQGDGWAPDLLSGFSETQRQNRAGWNARLKGLDWIAPPTEPSRAIAWIEARCGETGETVLVPADSVLIGRRERGDATASAVADTNGCAAGPTPDAALRSALYELIERDATGRWWYGQRARRVLEPDDVAVAFSVRANLRRRGRVLWLLDLTSDIPVPTVAALACDPQGRHVAAGFATRESIAAASHAAVIELMQMELRIAAALMQPAGDPDLAAWFEETDFEGRAPFHGVGTALDACPAPPGGGSTATCLRLLHERGCRIATIDFTRPAFGVPVFRAVSPDLCHWKPRFGRQRLLAHSDHDTVQGDARNTLRNPPFLRI